MEIGESFDGVSMEIFLEFLRENGEGWWWWGQRPREGTKGWRVKCLIVFGWVLYIDKGAGLVVD